MSIYFYYAIAAIIALIVLATFSTLLLRNRSGGQSEQQRFVEASTTTRRRGFFGLRRRQDETQSLLQAWVANRYDDPELKSWFRRLSQDELEAVTEDLKQFCAANGFDLKWVLNNGFGIHPELQDHVNQAVVYRLQSHQQTKRSEDDIRLYTRYRMLLADPTAPSNVALTQTLYNKLTDAGLAPVTPSRLILADEEQRRQYSLERIEAAATDNWVAFSKILKDILDVNEKEQAAGNQRRRRANKQATSPQPAVAQT